MRKLMNNTSPNVARNRTMTAGPLKIIWPNGVNTRRPAVSVTAIWNVSHETTPVSATPMAM
jgi:hypothetical protein